MKLVLYEDNYADEFDLRFFDIVTDEYWRWYLETAILLDRQEGNFGHNFGTNESVEYDNLDEFMDCFSVVDIPPEDEKILRKYFPSRWFTGIPELYIEDDRPVPF